jgi:hypothetical protein
MSGRTVPIAISPPLQKVARIMKRHLPSGIELSLFFAMALISTVIVAFSPQRDTAMFACTLPIFLVASLLGFRRSEIAQVGEVVEETDDSEPTA